MATQVDSHSDMAHARQSDGINVIFDQKSPGSSTSRSRSRSVSSSASSRSTGSDYRGRKSRRGRNRSSSSSSSSSCGSRSSSSSRSRSRSRSYPRCHRHSSRCRSDPHHATTGLIPVPTHAPRYQTDIPVIAEAIGPGPVLGRQHAGVDTEDLQVS
ncbi:hypothetical protein CCH79_00004664 [Gambusia affinis]|uniref:Uncharacterized protein n=1 Tax=Gambusia affinis TaxID=33528 RepID=A0A315UYX4_GAMAF|nr:hypothetical protein CCH79_00004664 [Gambusia affinis]